MPVPISAADDGDADDLGGLFPRRISKYDLIDATNQLAIMVDTGITISVCWGALSSKSKTRRCGKC